MVQLFVGNLCQSYEASPATQCYLPPDIGERVLFPLQPDVQASTRFAYLGGIEG